MLYSSISFSLITLCAAPIAAPEQPSVLVTSDTLILMWNSPPFEDTNGIIRYYMATITELDTGRMFTLRPNATVTTFSNLHPFYIYECTVAAYTVGLGPYSNIITVQLAEEGKYNVECTVRIFRTVTVCRFVYCSVLR